MFLVALIWDRRWRQALYCIACAVAAEAGSALILARLSGFTVAQVLHNAASTLGDFVEINGDLMILVQHGHTAWGAIQVVDMWLGFPLARNPQASRLYVLLALAVFAVVAVRLDKATRPPWLGFTALLACGMLLPYQGHDYTAIHLFLPLALLGARGVQVGAGPSSPCCSAFMLIPMSYGVIVFDVTVSVLVYPVVLATLLVTVLRVAPAFEPSVSDEGAGAGRGRLDARPALVDGDGRADPGGDPS